MFLIVILKNKAQYFIKEFLMRLLVQRVKFPQIFKENPMAITVYPEFIIDVVDTISKKYEIPRKDYIQNIIAYPRLFTMKKEKIIENIDYLTKNTEHEVYFLSSGWKYNPLNKKTYIEQTENVYAWSGSLSDGCPCSG